MAQEGQRDHDGDVEMTVPQPIFEFIKAPRLMSWSQPALVEYMRARRQYETKIWERCVATGEAHENVRVTIKSSMEPKILEHLAHYVFKTDVFSLSEERLRGEIERKAGSLMNDHVPDVEKLFAENLTMDASESDVQARVTKYFMAFDKIVEDHGLAAWVGRGVVSDSAGQQRMKMRCKLLVENLFPRVLRVDIERLLAVTHRHVKTNDVALYELIVERAARQQHFHQMQSELRKGTEKSRPSEVNGKGSGSRPKQGGSVSKDKQSKVQKGTAEPPRSGCLVCKGSHWLRDCPTATPKEKSEALAAAKDRRKEKQERVKAVRGSTYQDKERRVCINGVLEVPFCPDTGADSNIVSRALLDELRGTGGPIEPVELTPPVHVKVAGGRVIQCLESVKLDLRIETAAGPLHLANVSCLVLDAPEDEFLLGRVTMQEIGIDIDHLFEQLASGNKMNDADGDDATRDDCPMGFTVNDEEICGHLDRMLDAARDAGFESHLLPALRKLVYEYADVWRVRIGADPPADVEPMEVRLADGAQPFRSGVRKYAQRQQEFLREYVQELERKGLVRRNNFSRWACAALPVKKPHSDDYRITVDYRPVNRCTVPIAGAAPNLASVTQRVRGACGFGQFDLFKGFWQLPLAASCQELYSFVTEDGIFTPTRVPQGASDSAVHFQLQMNQAFKDMLFFEVLRSRRLKLNATKCSLFAPQVEWCGRIIDGEGIAHSEERLATLMDMPLPPTAAALQNFLCAANWLRESLVDYSRVVSPLLLKLEQVMSVRGRRKSQLAGVDLTWTPTEEDSFRSAVRLLATSAKQHFVNPDAVLCLFSDASNVGYAIVVTQVREWQVGLPVSEQIHELIVCRGGLFKGAQCNWSVIEKEAYPVVRACGDLAYMFERERGVRIFCDHANLVHIFAPTREVKPHLRGKLQRWALQLVGVRYDIEHIKGADNVWADIVSRWGQPSPATALSVTRLAVVQPGDGIPTVERNEEVAASASEIFTVHDTSDAYMHLSMQQKEAEQVASVKRVTTRSARRVSAVRPLQDAAFEWPTIDVLRGEQRRFHSDVPGPADDDGLVRVDGRLWVPTQARELLQRLFIVAHCGPEGHRGSDVMLTALSARFAIANSKDKVTRFVRNCLLCKHVKGGLLIQRPWGPTTTATKRNECLHLDYLELGDSYGPSRYVLVLKDELTHYCELVVADSANSTTAAAAVLDWYKRFGLPETWISDCGSHFKAALMQELAEKLKVVHKFTPVYSPWINGTVERVNRDVLQVLRAMLIELTLDTRNWPYLLPLIQANLNHSAVVSLGGHAPIELFTGLPAPSMLDTVVVPVGNGNRIMTIDMSRVSTQIEELRQHLASLHLEVVDRKEKRRAQELARAKGTTCNFEEGDYVLWSRADTRMRGGKLLVRWVGPFRVVRALSHSFLVAHLLTGDEYEVHGSRLKHYCDAELGRTAEIREHVATQGIVLGVRAIVGHQYDDTAKEWQLHVAWRGLQDAENSWEPFTAMYTDVPVLVTQYVQSVDAPELASLL